MKGIWRFLVLALVVSWAMAQDYSQKPELSKEPLTTEQIAIYRAVLAEFVKGRDGTLNLYYKTYPSAYWVWVPECVKYAEQETVPKSMVVHLLDPAVALSPKMVLVDPQRQQPEVKKDDSQNAVRQGNETTQGQNGNDANEVFRKGLFTFSEIVFDQGHRHALLTYSFSCPGLCGHSKTLVLEKVNGTWKITKECLGLAL
ncbi:MAG TPA: hypothetical protein VKE93_10070 [Candidatus Angelobacter sp.]|nr:hypothetical protein [Candidatus Angelobacter sp.]